MESDGQQKEEKRRSFWLVYDGVAEIGPNAGKGEKLQVETGELRHLPLGGPLFEVFSRNYKSNQNFLIYTTE